MITARTCYWTLVEVVVEAWVVVDEHTVCSRLPGDDAVSPSRTQHQTPAESDTASEFPQRRHFPTTTKASSLGAAVAFLPGHEGEGAASPGV